MEKTYYIYIVTNPHHTVLYTGITNNIYRRTDEHKGKKVKGFTKKYNADILVYYEAFTEVGYAIAREKQIKAGSRQKKIDLIESINPEWKDLSKDFF